ncbi:MAG: hypothetical protein ACOYEV_00855 [Candidatus Nanopelagicales bacterium]
MSANYMRLLLAAGMLAAPVVAVPAVGAAPLTVGTVAAAPASAVTVVTVAAATADDVIASMRTEPLFVETGYSLLTADQVEQLRAKVAGATSPMFVAMVSNTSADEAGGLDSLLRLIAAGVGEQGTFVLADERSFRTTSTIMKVADLADQAASSQNGAFQVIAAFVDLVQQRAAGQEGDSGTSTGESGNQGGFPGGALLVLALAGGAGMWLYSTSKRRARKQTAAEVAGLKKVLAEDTTALGEQMALVDQNDPRLGEAGRARLQEALEAYDRARRAADRMRSPEEASAVTGALDDARYAMACVHALAGGRVEPARRPVCLFDPRHGTSVRDVMWTPPPVGYQTLEPREVPACADCARTVDLGGMPAARMVAGARGQVPYWEGGAAYAPYARGYYDSYGANMLGAVFLGTMLGNMWMYPAMGMGMGMGGDWGDTGGGGDLGGGSFGGGDFGGGDFGGGGFGGGDFGGF